MDGSHRREPYLSRDLATISSICRGPNFAPRLEVGDVVVYLTTKGRYLGDAQRSNRLTAVLEVTEVHASHGAAAEWMAREGLPLPPNCIVEGTDGLPASACTPCSADTRRDAEERYRCRAERYPMYVIRRSLWLELHSPPAVTDAMLTSALGGVPVVRTPTTWEWEKVQSLLDQARLRDIEFASRQPDGSCTKG